MSYQEIYELYWNKNLSQNQIAEILSISRATIQSRMKIWNIPRRTRTEATRMMISKKPNLNSSEALAYILGVLYGDGSVVKNEKRFAYFIQLTVEKKEFADSFYKALKKINLNPWISKNGKYYRVSAQSCIFYDWFKNLTFDNIEKILNNSKKIKEFIRGFYESEGCIYQNDFYYFKGEKIKRKTPMKILSIFNTDAQVIMFVKKLLKKLNFHPKIYGPYKTSHKPIYHLKILKQEEIERFFSMIRPVIKQPKEN